MPSLENVVSEITLSLNYTRVLTKPLVLQSWLVAARPLSGIITFPHECLCVGQHIALVWPEPCVVWNK